MTSILGDYGWTPEQEAAIRVSAKDVWEKFVKDGNVKKMVADVMNLDFTMEEKYVIMFVIGNMSGLRIARMLSSRGINWEVGV